MFNMPTDVASSTKRDNTTPSCAVCNRRKVKCDRVYPCAPCRKTGLECTFPEPARKRARRKPPTPPPETLLVHQGTSSTSEVRRESASKNAGEGLLDIGKAYGGIGYDFTRREPGPRRTEDLGNAHLTASPSCQDHRRDLVFGARQSSHEELLQFSPAQTIAIGDAYRKHVDPVAKVFHSTSAWECLRHGSSPEWNDEGLDFSRASDQCLFRAVCFITTIATDGLGDFCPSDCHGQMLIQRCREDAEAALSEADFMKTRNFRVLQGFVLYLIGLQSLRDDETVWTMLGIAIRVASSMGLPQDIGNAAIHDSSQSSYRLEMRRRLWWAILALDARVTRILGRTGYLSHNFDEIPRPANVDDAFLSPSMSEIGEDSGGLSDAVYVRFRATLSDVLPIIYAKGNAADRCTDLIKMIEDAERQIEDEFIQYCDMTVPAQLLTFVAGRGYIKRLKLAMYSIFPVTENETPDTPYASEAFWLAKDSMDLFILLWTDASLKPWHWHWKDFFGWHTLRILVREISRRKSRAEALEAWKLVKVAAGLAVSAMKLGEEKSRLVGDLRMLIEAADVGPADSPERYPSGRGSMVRSIKPGMGSNPHNAMFPAMNMSFSTGVDLSQTKDSDNSNQGMFDLTKINWTEMDRVLLQLGTHSGS